MHRLIATLGFTAVLAAGCGAADEADVRDDVRDDDHAGHDHRDGAATTLADAAPSPHAHDGGAHDGDEEIHEHGTHGSRDAAFHVEGGSAAQVATFTTVYNTIIRYQCASSACHGSAASAYLSMAHKDGAHAALLEQEALGEPCFGKGGVRVVPGKPDESLLIKKLDGTAGCGQRMPRGAAPLPPEQVQLIRAWIYAGAKND